jgi:hypothetical protein
LTVPDARELAAKLRVFYFGYAIPVRELTGDRKAIETELESADEERAGPEWNRLALFQSASGVQALVIDHRH